MIVTRRFLPYFVTQCLGALNDNLFKNILLLMVTYSQVNSLPISVNLFVNLAAGLFILPFLLFSAHAGLIADHIDKALLIRRLKLLEIVIMACAMVAILTHSYLIMLLLLFLTGIQSAYFGPVKYSILPRALYEHELIRGNAWVELGTFIAILIGTLSAGLIVDFDPQGRLSALLVFSLAIIGYAASVMIPSVPSLSAHQKVKFAPFSGGWKMIKDVKKQPAIWACVIVISWFWFLGATYLTQFPNFSKVHLQGDATVVSLLLLLFSMGIGIGSLICGRLSFGQVELGVALLGLIGLAVFGFDLPLAVTLLEVHSGTVYSAITFITGGDHYRIIFDLFMIGVSGGLFIVPLYAFIQVKSEDGHCAQAIAVNNIANAVFMIASAVLSMILLGTFSWSILQLFTLLSALNLLVLIYLIWAFPSFIFACISYVFRHIFLRVKVEGIEKLVGGGAVLLINRELSTLERVILQGMSGRKMFFVSDNHKNEKGFKAWLSQHLHYIVISDALESTQPSIDGLLMKDLDAGNWVVIQDVEFHVLFSDMKIQPPKLTVTLNANDVMSFRSKVNLAIA
ncbi:MFS transporter [uncultured Shewanella sp.]|uniref:MFS transporter n=1 Tax=uncultured Shewanella sp. TaxID=173975 RepID=UPI002617DC91|nr:MFS transporter [uncultured Shewanella sp.]